MQLHQLSGKHKKRKVIGRGGKRGTYSGRGVKGQKSRAGHRIRPAIRDILKQIPKLRGRGKHSFTPTREKHFVLDVRMLERRFADGDLVSPKTLLEKGAIRMFGNRLPGVKILGGGELSKRFTIRNCVLSASARAAIEKAGGQII